MSFELIPALLIALTYLSVYALGLYHGKGIEVDSDE